MAHGMTRILRAMKSPPVEYVIKHPEPVKVAGGFVIKPRGMETYVSREKDRRLSGKARRRARKAANRR